MPEQAAETPGIGERLASPAPAQGFFSGGDRKTHLEQLRHLSQWSRRLLVVTGPRGVGKSTLYRQLSASLEPRAKAARISGTLTNGAREVLNAMVQGFGLAAPADADTQLLCDLIAAHAEEQDRSQRFCVVLIDDAEALEARALDVLARLAATVPLRMVLFGEIRLVPAMQRAASAGSVGWHEIRLSGFDVVDTRGYLDWRLRSQGHTDGLPFSDAQIKDIARRSEGLPGRIDQMADVLLARIQSGEDEHRRQRFPALHRALLAVLLVAIGFLWLVWPPPDDDVGESAPVERLEVPPAGNVRPSPVPDRSTTVESPVPAPETGDATDEPVGGPADVAAGAQTDTARRPETEPADETGMTDAAGGLPSATPPRRPGEPEPATEQRASPSRQPAPVTEAPPPVTEPPTPAVEPPAPVTETPAPVTETPAPAEPIEGADRVRDAAWIMSRPATRYTLQLASFSTAERASAYLAGQPALESFARFRQQAGGRILHVVIYGDFESRAAAQQAAARLPAGIGRVQPWIRRFGEVQAAVRTALQR